MTYLARPYSNMYGEILPCSPKTKTRCKDEKKKKKTISGLGLGYNRMSYSPSDKQMWIGLISEPD